MIHFVKKLSIFVFIFSLVVPPQAAYSLPTGATVTDGSATAYQYDSDTYVVEQSTSRAIIEYSDFSVGVNEDVQFIQPDASSITLNRVKGVNPSEILGKIYATGRIFLINPNGVIFGSGATVDVAGLVASSLDIDDTEFMTGDTFHFEGALASVVNNGNIRLHTAGGYIVLLGASVKNTGNCIAAVRGQTGKIALASGDKITVALDPSSIINVAVTDAATVNPDGENAAVINEGRLGIQGNEVILTAKTLETLFDQAINTSGIIEATDLRVGEGTVSLLANNDISVGGTILGGSVKIASELGNVTHEDGSVVDTGSFINNRTQNGDFQGYAGKDYTIAKNSVIDVNGDVDIYAVQDLSMDSDVALDATGDVFLTSQNGSILKGAGGSLSADHLVLNADQGIGGQGSVTWLETAVNTLSAQNSGSGDIVVSNTGVMSIEDTLSLVGLNTGVTGLNGVVNQVDGGKISIDNSGVLTVNAPVTSLRGNINLASASHIIQTALGDITVLGNDSLFGLPAPINLTSPSHTPGVVSTDRTVDVVWGVEDPVPSATPGNITIAALGGYTMQNGAVVDSNGGDVTVTANDDILLTRIDAGLGTADITSLNGDIVDNDLGTAPGDYDVIAHIIKLAAPNGSVGNTGPEEEIDLGLPYDFSYLWNNASTGTPDLVPDSYTASLDVTGHWQMATTSSTLGDGDWWFHVSTVEPVTSASAGPADIGPFMFRSSGSSDRFYGEEYNDEFPVYYEILAPSQFLSFEPATAIGLYAYHPITEVDEKAFDDIRLDAGAYEFIEDKLEKKKKFAPYFGG